MELTRYQLFGEAERSKKRRINQPPDLSSSLISSGLVIVPMICEINGTSMTHVEAKKREKLYAQGRRW